jgi:cytochrome c oxidase accessory protein FixG
VPVRTLPERADRQRLAGHRLRHRARRPARLALEARSNAAAQGLGDCIDCTLCVQVCPTGIDIRNGLQNECIGCAACIDVCDDVMDKMGYAKGLIRYATENGVVHGWTRLQMFRRALRPRVLVYGALLCVASIAFATSVALRSPFKVDVVKDRGALARVVQDGAVENVYRLQIMNRTEGTVTYGVAASGIDGLEVLAPPVSAGPAAVASVSVRLRLPWAAAQALAGRSVPVVFEVTGAGPDTGAAAARFAPQVEPSTFFVPRQ